VIWAGMCLVLTALFVGYRVALNRKNTS